MVIVKKRILLVDDEPDNSSIFKIALEDTGTFHVDIFDDSISALSAFRPDHYDLLILDIRMPKMDDYELYEKVKKIDDKVKACFLTASAQGYKEEHKQRFMPFNTSTTTASPPSLTKPITIDELVERINEMIEPETLLSSLHAFGIMGRPNPTIINRLFA
jgi:CheY-like chemotaxis protein